MLKGYRTIEDGARLLASELQWTDNYGGNIRRAAVLNPFNKKNVIALLNNLESAMKGVSKNEIKSPVPAKTDYLEEITTKDLINKVKKEGANILEDIFREVDNGVYAIHADCSEMKPEMIRNFRQFIVNNQPNPDLIEVCAEKNFKLLFLFSEDDITKYDKYGMISVRPISRINIKG